MNRDRELSFWDALWLAVATAGLISMWRKELKRRYPHPVLLSDNGIRKDVKDFVTNEIKDFILVDIDKIVVEQDKDNPRQLNFLIRAGKRKV